MFSQKSYSKVLIVSTFVAIGAVLLFIASPIFAQAPFPGATAEHEQVSQQDNARDSDEYNGIESVDNSQGISEDDRDISSHGADADEISDVDDSNEESQEIINEHQAQGDSYKGQLQQEQNDD